MNNDVSLETPVDVTNVTFEVENPSVLMGIAVGALVGVASYAAARKMNSIVNKIRYRKYYK